MLELAGSRDAAVHDAESKMAEHCGGPDRYTVVQEGEEVIEPQAGDEHLSTAWRIHYVCK